jgi:AraC-like DNA-binding protein
MRARAATAEADVTSHVLWTEPGLHVFRASFRRFSFPRHVHETFSIGLIEEGVNRFMHRGASAAAPEGTLCVVNPDEVHTGAADAQHGWQYVNVFVDEATMRRSFGLPASATVRFQGNVIDDADIVGAMRRLARSSPLTDPLQWEARLAEALLALSRAATLSSSPREVGSAKVAQARARLSQVEERPLRLASVAEELGVGTCHLVRAFTRAYGISPYAYQVSRRVALAQRLLTTTESLASIAQLTGFADQAHLTRQFRKRVGVTPGAFRAKRT